MSYWDTSAVVKLFASESDSVSCQGYAAQLHQRLVTMDFTRMELWTTLRRKEAEGALSIGKARSLLAEFDAACAHGEWKQVPDSNALRAEFERVVERCCSQTPFIFIRTLDALHVAAALVSGETEIVATDKRLRDAATLLGFQLFPLPKP